MEFSFDFLVPSLTESIIGPLTQPPTEEQKILKQQQIKAKGVSRGPSKLLSKFMPDEHRKDVPRSPNNKDKTPKKTKIPVPQTTEVQPPPPPPPAPTSAPAPAAVPPPPAVEPIIHQSALTHDSLSTPDDKFVSARDTIPTSRTTEEQEIEQYAEQIESMSNEQIMGLLQQASIYQLFESIQTSILPKLLECTLNGASFYRNMMKTIRFILQSDIDPHLIISFTNAIHIPDISLKHLKAILDHPTMRKEVRSFHILLSIIDSFLY